MAKKLLKSDDLKEPWVEAFKVGKVTDMAGNEHDFSEADLEDLNEGIHEQLKAGYQPPMVKGHPKVDDPRVGSVVDSKVENGVLKVKLDDVNNDFAEEVKKGGFKYLSASVYSNLKKGLRHLGALGAHAPAMKGMAPLCFGEGMFAEADKGVNEKDVLMFAESFAWDRLVPASVFERLVYRLESLGQLFRSQREQLIEKDGIDAANKMYPEFMVKDIESVRDVIKDANNFPKQTIVKEIATADPASSFGEPEEVGGGAPNERPNEGEPGSAPLENGEQNPQPETPPHNEPTASIPEGNSSEATRLSEENAALRAENETLKADKLAAQRLRAGAAFSETLDKAIADGRCNQVLKDNLMKVFGLCQEVPVDGEGCFGEGDERVNVSDVLAETVAALPKIVDFGEDPNMRGVPKVSAGEALAKYKAEQEAKGRVLTFAEAAEECFR